jgi:hypothetical protein
VSRQFGVVARAADLPAGLALATGNGEVAGSSTTRLAVYPDFLNFSGLERNIDAADSGSSIFSSWLFWLLLLLLLLAGYVSYKEKQRQLHKNARQF